MVSVYLMVWLRKQLMPNQSATSLPSIAGHRRYPLVLLYHKSLWIQVIDLQFLFIGVYFGFSMGMAPPLSYAYGDRKIDVCRKLEQYAHRFFAIAPLVIYALTYFLAPVGVSCFANTASPVFPIAVSGMRIYGLGFLFSGINIYAAVRMMAYGKGYFSGLITFLRSFALLLLFLTVLPQKFGLTGVWLAVPAAEVLTLLVAVWFLRPIQR